jgi:cytochrome P450 family 142 subfamily A polypeptide 1
MFERLLTRLPDLHLAADAPDPLPKRPSNFVCGHAALPVEFTPAARLG